MFDKLTYSIDKMFAFYKGHIFRKTVDGYYRCNQRGLLKGELLHRFVYTTESGKDIPEGYHIHHIDCDKENNDIVNLSCIEASRHTQEHNQQGGKAQICVNAMKEANEKLGYPGVVAGRKSQQLRGYPSLREANKQRQKPIARAIDGVIDRQYPSLLDAAKDIGKPPIHISECAHGKRKSAFGFEWMWVSE